jgi:hypothetical protein
MTTYIAPTSGVRTLPDIIGGQLTQTQGNPPFPGTQFTGPLLAGNNKESDGSGNLAGVGESGGTANTGQAVMAQSCVITQATNDGTAGQFACPIVIPAQSQILRMTLFVYTAWTGSLTTMGIGTGASATAFTTGAAVQGSTLGAVNVAPGTSDTQIANWINVGTQDVQIVVLSGNTGSGVGVLVVEYMQSNDLPNGPPTP